MAECCSADGLSDVDVDGPSKMKFRQAGGGKRNKAPEVRLSIFYWFLDTCESL